MTGAEKGFLLLTSHLGDPARPVLTTAQFRTLAVRAGQMQMSTATLIGVSVSKSIKGQISCYLP